MPLQGLLGFKGSPELVSVLLGLCFPTMPRRTALGDEQKLQATKDHCTKAPQWGAVDAEIKVPSDENTELKGSPLKAWSRSAY